MSTVLYENDMVVFGGRSVEEMLSNETFALDLEQIDAWFFVDTEILKIHLLISM
jgi:hypothetical protein